MEKKYLAKIIANDNEGLQVISACCTGAKVNNPIIVKKIKLINKNFFKIDKSFRKLLNIN